MCCLRRFMSWWQARRSRHLDRLASTDPRTHTAAAQQGQAGEQRKSAADFDAAARDRLREIDALRAAVKAARPR